MRPFFSTKLLILVTIITGLSLSLSAQTASFNYLGSVQTYTVPVGATQLAVDAVGAAGGEAYNCCSSDPVTLGGRVQCTINVTPGTVYYIYVGSKGQDWVPSGYAVGGYNGGANGGSTGATYCAAGGGASDIRLSASGSSYADRLVVAGGAGGGGDFDEAGGAGGGLTGGTATGGACGGGPSGPSCTTGTGLGAFGIGGMPDAYSSGGGGGGWWGGNGGVPDGGGAGGSSFTDPILVSSVIHTQGYVGATGDGIVIIAPNCMAPGSIAGNIPLCPGDSNYLANPTGDTTGVWVSSNPAVAAVDSFTGLVAGLTAGTDTITFVLANPCGGPSAQAYVVVTVNPFPGPITGPMGDCLGSGITLSDSGSGTWANNNSALGSVDPSTGIYSGIATGTDTVSFTFTSTGCTVSRSVVINPLPAIDTVTGGGSYCAGGSGVHIGLNTSAAGVIYQPYLSGSASGSGVTGTGSALDLGSETAAGNYTVNATTISTGCSVYMAGSANILITPVVIPTAVISSSMGDTLCAGTSTVFTTSYTHGGTAPAFHWMKNGANVGGDSATYAYTPSNGDVIVVKLISDTVCAIPDSAMDTLVMTVKPNGTPTLAITSAPGAEVCQFTTVTLNATPAFGGYTPSYTWVLNTISVSTSASYSFTPNNGDHIYCIMTSDYQCRLATTAYSNVIDLMVDTPVVPSVTIASRPGLYLPVGHPDTLTATVYNGGTNPLYQWYLNNAPVAAATTNVFYRSSFADKDSVSCLVTRNDICGMSAINSVVFRVHPVGVTQISFAGANIQVTPNPNNGTFTVKGTIGTSTEEVAVDLTNMLGQTVYKNTVTALDGVLNEQITTNNSLAEGIYILGVHTTSGSGTFRIVVEK